MVGFIHGETLQGNRAMVDVESIVTVIEDDAGNSDNKKVIVNTRDGKRLELLMSMDEFQARLLAVFNG